MMIRTFTLAIALSLAAFFTHSASATLINFEGSYELDATLVNVPSGSNGYLLFRACPQCSVKSLQVSPKTQYILGNDSVTLAEFHQHGVMQGLIYVFYDKESQLVTRVRLRAGGLNESDD